MNFSSGVIILNKSKNITSFTAVKDVKRLLKVNKIGHSGTLDPIATGVLPICFGKATKLSNYISNLDKEYKATFILGIKTDTYDITGNITDKKDIKNINIEDIKKTINSFIGEQNQLIPIYSAKKINGKKLYEYARNNQKIDLPYKKINITNITINEISLPKICFTVNCSKGTYIRSLINDIGIKLNTYATMVDLVRLKHGQFNLENSYTIDEIKNLLLNNKVSDIIIKIDEIFNDLQKIIISKELNDLLYNGNIISSNLVKESLKNNTDYLVYDYKNSLVGIYSCVYNKELKPKIFLYEK